MNMCFESLDQSFSIECCEKNSHFWFQASDNEERKNALVIMPIPASTSEDEIKAVFVNATHISSVSFTKPRKNRFAPGEICCAIVEFDAPETCAEALESVSSSELEIAGMKCKAQKSEEKVIDIRYIEYYVTI